MFRLGQKYFCLVDSRGILLGDGSQFFFYIDILKFVYDTVFILIEGQLLDA